MERWVAIVLALLIIVVGFFVVKKILDTSTDMPGVAGDAECRLKGGACKTGCAPGEETIDNVECSKEGELCCAKEK